MVLKAFVISIHIFNIDFSSVWCSFASRGYVVKFNGALLTLSVADPVRMNFLCCSQCQLRLIDSSPLKPLLPSTAPLQLLPQIILLLPLLAAVVESEKAVCEGWAAVRGFGGGAVLSASLLISDGGHRVATQRQPDHM